MIVNINYSAVLAENTSKFEFRSIKPKQYVEKCKDFTMIIFKNRKCRIMGCKKPLLISSIPYKITNLVMQSITLTENLGHVVNLSKIASKLKCNALYEPELFPALRVTLFNPMCVNLFASGKLVIMGIKSLDFTKIVDEIIKTIRDVIDKEFEEFEEFAHILCCNQ